MSMFNRKNAAAKRTRTSKGVPLAGAFATETKKEATGVAPLTAPASSVTTGRTGPLTETDRAHVDTAVETIAKKIGEYREYSEKTGSKLHALAASFIEESVPDRLAAAQTVDEASDAIRSGVRELRRQSSMLGLSRVPDLEQFRDIQDTLMEMNLLVGETDERTGIKKAADEVESELAELRNYAEKTGSITHRATADAAADLPWELQMAESAEEACAAVDRADQDLADGGRGIAFLKEHSELRSSLAGVRDGIESAAGRAVPRLTREERAVDDARRDDFRAMMARSERAHGRIGIDGNFVAR